MTCTTNYHRIVVKIGTSSLTHENGTLDLHHMEILSRTLADIKNMGHEVILVSSGAIGIGVIKMKMPKKPQEVRLKQATAAIGQCEMMHLYDKFFGEYNQTVGQILLTREDVDHEGRAHNLKNTFDALLEMGVIPVVNENDSVSYAEIEHGKNKVFGDNDTLSAMVASLVEADLLILLSDIDGLYDSDPHKNPDAKLIPIVEEVNDDIRQLAGGAGSSWGTGGMSTKIDAAQIATSNGIEMVITHGAKLESLYDILEGKPVGTRFLCEKK